MNRRISVFQFIYRPTLIHRLQYTTERQWPRTAMMMAVVVVATPLGCADHLPERLEALSFITSHCAIILS